MDCKSIEKASNAIADKIRLSIIMEVAKRKALSFCDIQEIVGLSQPCISHHIKLLTDSEILISTKEGRSVTLHINKEKMKELADFFLALS